jgi:hypothetical protein
MFLDLFGLRNLGDLPPLHEFSELWDEHKELVDTTTLPLPGLETSNGQESKEANEPEAPLPSHACDDTDQEGTDS